MVTDTVDRARFRQGLYSESEAAREDFDTSRQDTDVVIERRYIERWLATTRRSISSEETKGMATEFVVWRNGDTSDDGSMRA